MGVVTMAVIRIVRASAMGNKEGDRGEQALTTMWQCEEVVAGERRKTEPMDPKGVDTQLQ